MLLRGRKGLRRLATTTAATATTTTTRAISLLDLHIARGFSGSAKSSSNKASANGGGQARGGGGGVAHKQRQRRPGAGKSGAGGTAVGRATKGGSSGLWMRRHLKDPYVSAAIEAGAPSRAAFKLVEINDRHGVLSAGDRAPASRGGGSRGGGAPPALPPPLPEGRLEAAERKGGRGRGAVVVAVDLLDMEADLPGVQAIRGDFRDEEVESRIFGLLSARERLQPAPGNERPKRDEQRVLPLQPPGATAAESGEERADLRRDETKLRSSDGYSVDDDSVGDGVDEEEAFLLRGTSASRTLLPRPEQPSTDSLEHLFLAVGTGDPATAAAKSSASDGLPPPPSADHRHGDAAATGKRPQQQPPPRRRDPPPPTRASVVLSDMAPSFSGDRDTDQARVAALVLDALAACLGDEVSRRREPPRNGAGERGEHSVDPLGGGEGSGAVRLGGDVTGGGKVARMRREEGNELGATTVGTLSSNVGGSSIGGTAAETSMSSPRKHAVGGRDEWGGIAGEGTGLLARGGTFLGKFFAGRDEREVKEEAERLFERVKVVKPPASRSGSGEMYLLATGFLLGGWKT
ncbi:putative ribosomal RNA methyltransferase 2 [Ectocarpus siliculosus]|uniref:rRNA methyltransferase 2, mitochondrial n=1 Tax=Ectocarpus siliculosus TaxID=2880 RepID=D7G1J5_ECTSI|nr:putative ribosomal RNA methyltransferase 2 [Ectocarpus siliculosus]|eukprot:CBJ26803.1 putative ribosomal RNA methyltransferase 2 [Ectocarpus siliculosus]